MIEYVGPWSFLKLHGSVLPRAFMWAFPCSCLVFAYRALYELWWPGFIDDMQTASSAETTAAGLFTSILGFCIVFRANIAYGRFWEGITLVERGCAVWLNGASNLIAFSNAAVERQAEVAAFQHLLTRLMSLLLSISLSDISRLDISAFPTLSLDGISPDSLAYLESAHSKQKVILQWIQRLVVEQERLGVLDVTPPILSRVFQEFSVGIVHFIDAKKTSFVPFPFPFAQVVAVMLTLFSTVLMPFACAVYMKHVSVAVYTTFLVIFMYTGIHSISIEIEQPFGGDPNDLPLQDVNRDFIDALTTLLEAEAQQTPILVKSTREINLHVRTCKVIAERRSMSLETPVVTASSDACGQDRRRSKLGMMWSRLSSKGTPKPPQVFPRCDLGSDHISGYRLGESEAASSAHAPSQSSLCSLPLWSAVPQGQGIASAAVHADRSQLEMEHGKHERLQIERRGSPEERGPESQRRITSKKPDEYVEEQSQEQLRAQVQSERPVAADNLAASWAHRSQSLKLSGGSEARPGRASPKLPKPQRAAYLSSTSEH